MFETMPTCTSCENEWSWWQALKNSFTLKLGMTCPYCGEKNYVTTRTQNKTVIINFIPLTLMMIVNIYFGFTLITLLPLIGMFLLSIVLYPFWMKLSNEEKYFW